MKTISTPAIFTGFRSKVDRSIGFSGVTPELSTTERALFFELQNMNVQLQITPEGETAPEYKVEKDLNQKSPSARLRAVLFVYWKQQGVGEWEDFYSRWMTTFIDKIKAELE